MVNFLVSVCENENRLYFACTVTVKRPSCQFSATDGSIADHSGRARTVSSRSNTGIVGSNSTRGMDVCVRLFCVQAVALRWADPPSKESYCV
jgi:hypothetical protein